MTPKKKYKKREKLNGGHTSTSPTYMSWIGMKKRCERPTEPGYKKYGACGITVCARWSISFNAFLADMGERPEGMTLDRWPDKTGNYEPGNCRWATPKEQARNRTTNHLVTVGDKELPVSAWAELTGISAVTIHGRLEKGWTPEDAVSIKPDRSKKRGPMSAEMKATISLALRTSAKLAAHRERQIGREFTESHKQSLREAWVRRRAAARSKSALVRDIEIALGLSKGGIWHRIKNGWPVEEAYTTPNQKNNPVLGGLY